MAKLKDFLLRWKFRYLVFMGYADCLKRRVAVENYLWQAAAGQVPLPDEDKCKELAKKLGMPSELSSK